LGVLLRQRWEREVCDKTGVGKRGGRRESLPGAEHIYLIFFRERKNKPASLALRGGEERAEKKKKEKTQEMKGGTRDLLKSGAR